MGDWNDASQEAATQPYTQPFNDLHRTEESIQVELADVFCILHPISITAFITTNKIHDQAPTLTCIPELSDWIPSESSDSAPGSFELASKGLGSYDLALRFSQTSKDGKAGFTFGRDYRKCDYGLYTNPAEGRPRISNIHFRIVMNQQGILLLEDHSTNGTIVDSRLHKAENGVPSKRTLQNGSIITFVKPRTGDDVIKFIVRIPTREGIVEDRYDQQLQLYLAKYYPNAPEVVTQAHEAELARQDRNQAPDDFENGINQVTAAVRSHRQRTWHGGEKYNKQEILGQGAYATVFKVTTKTDGTVYAAKEIDKEKFQRSDGSMSPEELMSKITNEMNIMRKIKHPNVVAFIEHIDFYNRLYLIMEYIPGGDLSSQIHNGNLLTEGGAMLMSLQMLNALKWLHARGIAHRDIKPENILMVSKEPFQAKLADFGLAKLLEEGDGSFLRSFCGTLLYCAPEVYSEYREFDVNTGRRTRPGMRHLLPNLGYSNKVDIWSLGAVLFHAIAGTVPWPVQPGWRHDDYLVSIMASQPDFSLIFSKRRHSWESCEFLSKMLTKRPDQRFPVELLLGDRWLNPARHIYAQQRAEVAIHEGDDEDEIDEDEGEVDFVDVADPENLAYNASQLSIDENNLAELEELDDDLNGDPSIELGSAVPLEHFPQNSNLGSEFECSFDASAFLEQAVQDASLFRGNNTAILGSSNAYKYGQHALSTSALSGKQREWESMRQRIAMNTADPHLDESMDENPTINHEASTIIEPRECALPHENEGFMARAFNESSNRFINVGIEVDAQPSAMIGQRDLLQPIDQSYMWKDDSDYPPDADTGIELSEVDHVQVLAQDRVEPTQEGEGTLVSAPLSSLRVNQGIAAYSINNTASQYHNRSSTTSRRRLRGELSFKNARDSKRPATHRTMSEANLNRQTPVVTDSTTVLTIERQPSNMSTSTLRSSSSARTRQISTTVAPELFWDPRDRSTHVHETYGITGAEVHEMMDEATAQGMQFFSNAPSFFTIRDMVRARVASRSASVNHADAGTGGADTSVDGTDGSSESGLRTQLAEYAPEEASNRPMSRNGWRPALMAPIDHDLPRRLAGDNPIPQHHVTPADVMLRSFEQVAIDVSSDATRTDRITDATSQVLPMRMGPMHEFIYHLQADAAGVSQADRSEPTLLAYLRSARDSAMAPILVHIYSPVSVWGRGAHTSPSYYRRSNNQVPKYAFKLALYTPGNPTTKDHSAGAFWISPMNNDGLYINGVRIPTAEYAQPFVPSMRWVKLHHLDEITVFRAADGTHNTLRFECYVGRSAAVRPGGYRGPLDLLSLRSDERRALDDWVLLEQQIIRHRRDLVKDDPRYRKCLEDIFIASENAA